MNDPVRLGIAGCGRIAERGYLPAASGWPGSSSPPSPTPTGSAQGGSRGFSSRRVAFASAEEMVAAGGVDASSSRRRPTATSRSQLWRREAGLPSLVEKPPAHDLAGALELAALDPAPAIGFNRRFLQGVELAPAHPGRGLARAGARAALPPRRLGRPSEPRRGAARCRYPSDRSGVLSSPARGADRRSRRRLRAGAGRAWSWSWDGRGRGSAAPRIASTPSGSRSRIGAAGSRGEPDRRPAGRPPAPAGRRGSAGRFAAPSAGVICGRRSAGRARRIAGRRDAGVAAMSVVEAARRSAELGGAEVTVGPPGTRLGDAA